MARTTCHPGREATRDFARCTPRPGTIKRAMCRLLLLLRRQKKRTIGKYSAAWSWLLLRY
ncbi:MAG: hypothetical protein JRG73_00615 [Deltaproteobacteria bacterium]|nr:hypothetical protein [Deltaproteobacteria bacterium]